jgi:hypothetical protein
MGAAAETPSLGPMWRKGYAIPEDRTGRQADGSGNGIYRCMSAGVRGEQQLPREMAAGDRGSGRAGAATAGEGEPGEGEGEGGGGGGDGEDGVDLGTAVERDAAATVAGDEDAKLVVTDW